MSVTLLDVNVLIALMWKPHAFHNAARDWFASRKGKPWATCPITQQGFVRLISNSRLIPEAVSAGDAARLLADNLKSQHHQFWPDSISLAAAIQIIDACLKGHQQITDAYLLGLAVHNKGKLATFDRRISVILPPASPHLRSIELIEIA